MMTAGEALPYLQQLVDVFDDAEGFALRRQLLGYIEEEVTKCRAGDPNLCDALFRAIECLQKEEAEQRTQEQRLIQLMEKEHG